MSLEGALKRYGRMVAHVAHRLSRVVPSMDADDIYQEGLMFLVDLWGRPSLCEVDRIRIFKRDVFNHMRNRVRHELVSRNPGTITIDLDTLFAREDCSVLSFIYAREFEREAYRLVTGIDRIILDCMIGNRVVRMDNVCSSDRASGEWLLRLSEDLGITKNSLSQRISQIRRVIRETLVA